MMSRATDKKWRRLRPIPLFGSLAIARGYPLSFHSTLLVLCYSLHVYTSVDSSTTKNSDNHVIDGSETDGMENQQSSQLFRTNSTAFSSRRSDVHLTHRSLLIDSVPTSTTLNPHCHLRFFQDRTVLLTTTRFYQGPDMMSMRFSFCDRFIGSQILAPPYLAAIFGFPLKTAVPFWDICQSTCLTLSFVLVL